MKKILLAALLTTLSASVLADQYVDGYIRKDGTYVPPHFRSSPDSVKWNNFSSENNSNPYTGERGTRPAYPQYEPYPQPRQRRR